MESVFFYLVFSVAYLCNVCHCAVSLVSATCKLRWIFESVSCDEWKQDDFVTTAMNFVAFAFHVVFYLSDFPFEIEAMMLVYYPFWLTHYGNSEEIAKKKVLKKLRSIRFGFQSGSLISILFLVQNLLHSFSISTKEIRSNSIFIQ